MEYTAPYCKQWKQYAGLPPGGTGWGWGSRAGNWLIGWGRYWGIMGGDRAIMGGIGCGRYWGCWYTRTGSTEE